MVKKRMLSLVLLLTLVIGLIAGATIAADDVVTIQYAFWGNPTAIGVEKDIIDQFEQANPKIKVEPVAVAYDDYHPKMLTMIAGGLAPDVMRVDSYVFADFMKAHALKEIDDQIKKDKIDLDWYYPSALADCVYNGHYYGLPWASGPILMWLNTKMFKDAGIPLPSYDWKWDDFVNICKAMSKGEGINRQYGFGGGSSYNGILPFVWGAGGDLFDKGRKKFALDSPVATKQIQELANLVKKGYAPDPADMIGDASKRMFFANKIAIIHDAAVFLIDINKVPQCEWLAYPFPGGEKSAQTTINKANCVGISSSTKKFDAAWTFLKFLREPAGPGERLYMQNKRMAPTGDDSEMWKLYTAGTVAGNVPEVIKLVNQKYGHALPLVTGWAEIDSTVRPQMTRIFTGQLTAEAAMKEIAPKVQAILDRNK